MLAASGEAAAARKGVRTNYYRHVVNKAVVLTPARYGAFVCRVIFTPSGNTINNCHKNLE